jgi:hypothetical protein
MGWKNGINNMKRLGRIPPKRFHVVGKISRRDQKAMFNVPRMPLPVSRLLNWPP